MPLAALLLVGLAGCGPNDAAGAAAVETAFLEALADGDGEAALALTTLSEDDITCMDMVSNYEDLTVGITIPEVDGATVSGDTAEVKFHYTMVISSQAPDIYGTHTLVRDGDSWLIELPEYYSISATLPTDVVAQISVGNFGAEPACLDYPSDGSYTLFALPGKYTLSATDPKDVFNRGGFGTEFVVSDIEELGGTQQVSYIQNGEREQVAIDIKNALIDYVERCAESGFIDTYCPEGLPKPDGSITVDEWWPARFSGYPADVAVFSEDGLTWRFTASGENFLFQRNGTAETFPMSYAGFVTRDPAGTITVVPD